MLEVIMQIQEDLLTSFPVIEEGLEDLAPSR